MSTALYVRRPEGNKNDLYVLGKSSEDGPRVLCVALASSVKTLPLFSDRESARRFLRDTPLRFGLLESGWRSRRISGSELGSLFFLGIRTLQRRIVRFEAEGMESLFGSEAAER